MKWMSTTQMRRRGFALDYSSSVPGPSPGSRYYPVPDETPDARTLEEILAHFDGEQRSRQQREELRRQEEAEWRAARERREAEDQIERATRAAADAAERSRIRKTHAAEQAALVRRRAEGRYSGPVTLKEAFSLGWVDEEPDHYGGERLTLKGHSLTRNMKTAVSRTEWKRRGYVVKDREDPHATVTHGEYGPYDVFREDQVEPTRAEAERLACIALLDQLALNRAAAEVR